MSALSTLSGCGRERPKLEPVGEVHQAGRLEVGHAAVFGVASFTVDRPATVRSIRVLNRDGATVLSADLIIGYSGYQCYPDGPSAVERRGRPGVVKPIRPVRGARLVPGKDYGVDAVVAVDRIGTFEVSGAEIVLSDGSIHRLTNQAVVVEGFAAGALPEAPACTT